MGKNIQPARTRSSPHRKIIPSQSKVLWKVRGTAVLRVLRLAACARGSVKQPHSSGEAVLWGGSPAANKCHIRCGGSDLPHHLPQGLLCSKCTDPWSLCPTLAFKMLRKIREGRKGDGGNRRHWNKNAFLSLNFCFRIFVLLVKTRKAE